MALLHEVEIEARSVAALVACCGATPPPRAAKAVRRMASRLRGRVVWHVSSTARGGGVAEMLRSEVGYVRGAGIDCRWLVISTTPEFLQLTKRIHNALHGGACEELQLSDCERFGYERVSAANAAELWTLVRKGDVVILHDPQTVGLLPSLRRHGAFVIWRCHIGTERRNFETRTAWQFLAPYVEQAHACVFTRRSFVPDSLRLARLALIPPTIDPLSPKNQAMDEANVAAILMQAGLLKRNPACTARPVFRQADGSEGCVRKTADVVRFGGACAWETPFIVQVSRWDRLKDHIGVMHGFARFAATTPSPVLMLAGPNLHAVADDPEGRDVFREVLKAWCALPRWVQQRVQLVMLPLSETQEDAAIVNALQRRATVVVQKSLEEGFGLTVTEAMWKARPVIASRVGGIKDQIEHGRSGLLLDDATDTKELADALGQVFADPTLAAELGQAAQARVRERFLCLSSLYAYAELITQVLDASTQGLFASLMPPSRRSQNRA